MPRVSIQRNPLLGVSPKKSLSQNFLVNHAWAQKLVSIAVEGITQETSVWEIGPGTGALTRLLAPKVAKPLVLFEKDERCITLLKHEFQSAEYCSGDFLQAPVEKWALPPYRVMSNLPYQLAGPILIRLLELPVSAERMVLMFQREVAQRLLALPNSPAYNALSVRVQARYGVRSVGILPPGNFYPAPQVDSQVLCFNVKQEELFLSSENARAFDFLVRVAFRQRRKTLFNNLRKEEHPLTAGCLEASRLEGLPTSTRAQELSVSDWLRLFRRAVACASQTLMACLGLAALSSLPSFAGGRALASQELNYGLGGVSSGRMGAVTAEPTQGFSAIYNPALLAVARRAGFATTLGIGQVSGVVPLPAQAPGMNAGPQLIQLPLNLWSFGATLPVAFSALSDSPQARHFGLGASISSPMGMAQSFQLPSDTDPVLLRYGNADTQLKATLSAGGELIPRLLSAGVGVSFFSTIGGNTQALVEPSTAHGRMSINVGMNSAWILGLFMHREQVAASLVWHQGIAPQLTQQVDSSMGTASETLFVQSWILSSAIFYEPELWESDIQYEILPHWSASVGATLQNWQGFQGPFLALEQVGGASSPNTGANPGLNTVIAPRISTDYRWGKLRGMLGYTYQPQVLQTAASTSATLPLFDAPSHRLGSAIAVQVAPSPWLDVPWNFTLFSVVHILGGGGGNMSGSVYFTGISLGVGGTGT